MQEFLTSAKLKELEIEIEHLRTTRRKEIAEALEYAKSLGDLSENQARNSIVYQQFMIYFKYGRDQT